MANKKTKQCRVCRCEFVPDSHHFHICQRTHYAKCDDCGRLTELTSPSHELHGYKGISVDNINDSAAIVSKHGYRCSTCDTTKQCVICGKRFQRSRHKQNICSNHTTVCKECGKPFTIQSISQIINAKNIDHCENNTVILKKPVKCPDCLSSRFVKCVICGQEFQQKRTEKICEGKHQYYDSRTDSFVPFASLNDIGKEKNIERIEVIDGVPTVFLKDDRLGRNIDCTFCGNPFKPSRNQKVCRRVHYLRCHLCGKLHDQKTTNQLHCHSREDFNERFIIESERPFIFSAKKPTVFDACVDCRKKPEIQKEITETRGKHIHEVKYARMTRGNIPFENLHLGSDSCLPITHNGINRIIKNEAELVFMVFAMSLGREWHYEERAFPYVHPNKKHPNANYVPDFIIGDAVYEVKSTKYANSPKLRSQKKSVESCGLHFYLIAKDRIEKLKRYLSDRHHIDMGLMAMRLLRSENEFEYYVDVDSWDVPHIRTWFPVVELR